MPWKVISPRICRESAQSLMEQLNQDYPIEQDRVINWGNSVIASTPEYQVFGNKCAAVARSVDKREFFRLCNGLSIIPVMTDWQGEKTVGHYSSAGHAGIGVKVINSAREFIDNGHAYLYTKFIKGTEYRAYFCYNKVIDIYKKVRISAEITTEISTPSTHGYIQNPIELERVKGLRKYLQEMTLRVANRIELSMGAVDFIIDDNYGIHILESNSAPSLVTSQLLQSFAEEINKQLFDKE